MIYVRMPHTTFFPALAVEFEIVDVTIETVEAF